MQAPPGGRLVLNFKDTLSPPDGDAVGLAFNSDQPALVGVSAGRTSRFGLPTIRVETRLQPTGWGSLTFPQWLDQKHSIARVAKHVNPSGWDSGIVQAPTYVRWRRYLQPIGFYYSDVPLVSVRLGGGYQPAPGANVNLNFAEPLVPPPGSSVVLEFGASGYTRVNSATAGLQSAFGTPTLTPADQLRPSGFGPLTVFGTPNVQGTVRYVSLSLGIGPPSPQFGTAVATKKAVALLPPGIASAAFGTPILRLQFGTIQGIGFSTAALGAPKVELWNRYIKTTGFDASAYGTQRVSHEKQYVDSAGSINPQVFGTAWVSRSPRSIEPVSIFQQFYSLATVGGDQYLQPLGFDGLTFGTRIIPESRSLYPLGFAGAFGVPAIFNYKSFIVGKGFATRLPEDRWGRPTVYNLRQFITQYNFPESELNPPAQDGWTAISNRNRTIQHHSTDPRELPAPTIANTARVLSPTSIAPPPAPAGDMISYRVRYLPIDGIEPFAPSYWVIVHNSARLVRPAGLDATRWGNASLVNTRRYFPYIGAFNAASYGTAMVDFAIRELTIPYLNTIAPPLVPLPNVKLRTRYIEAIGFDAYRSGAQFLEIHFTLIKPHWAMVDKYGEPFVRNVTPELGTRGRNSEEYGDTHVRLQWRPVNPDGSPMQQFGLARIADRKQRIVVGGVDVLRFGDKLKVIRIGAEPPSLQTISLRGRTNDDGSDANGNGIGVPDNQVPVINLNQQVLYVHSDADMARYGSPRITANTIRVEPGYQELLVGEPLVALKIRTLTVSSIEDVFNPSPARITPHTIWAVVEAPEQAIDNHPPQHLHYVDAYNKPPGAICGIPTLTLQHRSMRTFGADTVALGTPSLANKTNYVQLTGWNSLRFGWHMVPFNETLEQFDSTDTMEFGEPAVTRPPYLGTYTVLQAGASMTVFGATRIELFNRELPVQGFSSLQMGASQPEDSPYQWQHLRVGPLVPTMPVGNDMSRFGLTWISNWVRDLSVTGFDAFVCDYDLTKFNDRMRVRRGAGGPPLPATRTLRPVGLDATGWPVPNVRPGARYIRPDGNSDQFRKGAF